MRIAILLAASAGLAASQTVPTFEVVSVKPHPLQPGHFVFRQPSAERVLSAAGDRFNEHVATLQDLIVEAYGVKDYQISSLPDWAQSGADHFDVVATLPAGATPTSKQLQLMLQSMLADRFQLKLHREMKELPVYALVIAKNGSKLRELSDATPPTFDSALSRSTVAMLISMLANVVDRPVIDHTGLTGGYEYATPDWRQFIINKKAGALDADTGQSVFTAVQEQLGLKLEPRKEPAEILIIDRAEKPSGN